MNAPEKSILSRPYNNRELVPDHAHYFARWAEGSQRARGTMTCHLDLRYGDAPGETLDLFPARKGDGSCVMFIHGGYWRSLDKRDFSFLAPTFDRELPKDLWKGGLAISGLYDLRPLVEVEWLNVDLRLDEAAALRLSPAFMPPATRAPVMTCVGGDESSEFLRQNALLGERWRAAFAGDVSMPGKNHFSVIDALADAQSALFQGARKLMKLDK